MAYLDKVSISGTTYNVQDTSTQAGVSNVFSTTTAYSVGQYVWYDGDGTGAKLYRFTAAHAAGDWVGSDAVQVALADDVTDLKSAFETEIGAIDTNTVTVDYTSGDGGGDGKDIYTTGANAGTIYDSPTYSVSRKISLADVTSVNVFYTGSNGYSGYVFYNANDGYIRSYAVPASTNQSPMDVPDGATYMRVKTMTSRKNVTVELTEYTQGRVYDEIDTKLDTAQGVGNAGKMMAVDDEGNIVPKAIVKDLPIYMQSHPVKALLPEMSADFAWCSMVIPAAFTGKNVVLTVSGSANSNQLTASAITPDGLSVSDVGTDWVGGVLCADGENYTVCNFKYVSGSTLEVFPPLESAVSNGTLSTLMYDSGATTVGLHLTENGYKAYSQNLFKKNPKHCEVGKYIARFRSDVDAVSPFTWYGGTISGDTYRFTSVNQNRKWMQRMAQRSCDYNFSASYTAHTTKSGIYWEVDLKGQSGYLEAYIYAVAPNITLPQDQPLTVVVTIDGEAKLTKTITDSVCHRIIVDYEAANSGRLEVYSNKWAGIDGSPYGIGVGRVTWWVNDLAYADDKLFPKGAVIGQEFDSWGVFHDGASGKELERLQNSATGVTVPYTNHSKGDQTSAWGKAWFYENVWKYHPAIGIFDFVINDFNSVGISGIPATIEGPDGTEYNNKITSANYAENMTTLEKMVCSNNIQPIFMRNCQSIGYAEFTFALIDAMSEEV